MSYLIVYMYEILKKQASRPASRPASSVWEGCWDSGRVVDAGRTLLGWASTWRQFVPLPLCEHRQP